MAKVLTIKQSPENEVPTEVFATSVKSISDGIKKLRSGRLNDRALFLLIQDAVGGVGPERGPKQKLALRDIKAVLDGIEALERTFLRKPTAR